MIYYELLYFYAHIYLNQQPRSVPKFAKLCLRQTLELWRKKFLSSSESCDFLRKSWSPCHPCHRVAEDATSAVPPWRFSLLGAKSHTLGASGSIFLIERLTVNEGIILRFGTCVRYSFCRIHRHTSWLSLDNLLNQSLLQVAQCWG